VAVRRRAERQGAGGDEHADVVVVGVDAWAAVGTLELRAGDGAETSLRRILTRYGS
jgi:hypothetical protein